jgi:acetyl esterase/lipase
MRSIFHLIAFVLLYTALMLSGAVAQDQIIEVWPDGAPGAIKNLAYIEGLASDKPNRVLRVSNPTLAIYLPDQSQNTGTAVLILPGGGYRRLAMDHEGYDMAEWLNSIGVAAFLLKYRLPNDSIMVDKKIGPLQDAQEAMRLIRRHAGKWQINPNKVGVIGFSAGGHLAATLSTRFADVTYQSVDQISARPDFAILGYPVISMDSAITHSGSRRRLLGNHPADSLVTRYSNELQVSKTTPPTFILLAADDRSVNPENSIRYFQALQHNGVKAELHIYQQGGHGFGLALDGAGESMWTKNCQAWLKSLDLQ